MSGFKDHFSDRAAAYAAFRPRYPAALFDWLAEQAPGRGLAWDAATGNGQAALGLAERFERVVATDASAEQIAHAAAHPRIAYRVARAEDGAPAAGTCDLVTVAQALHWLDHEAFFAAVQGALRPGGVFAAWVYVDPALADGALNDVFQVFARRIGDYWPPERKHTDDGYRSIALPFDDIPAPAFTLEMSPTLAEFAGYLRTWSATRRYVSLHGDDPVREVEARLAGSWPAGSRRLLRWPLAMRAGRAGHFSPPESVR